MPQYFTRSVSADWLKCKTCEALADVAIEVRPVGKRNNRGARTLGFYCAKHSAEKLHQLRTKTRT